MEKVEPVADAEDNIMLRACRFDHGRTRGDCAMGFLMIRRAWKSRSPPRSESPSE